MKNYNFNEAIKECNKKFEDEFVACNILKATVASNGKQGGNYSHGGVTCFKLEDLACTAWDIKVKENADGGKFVEIVLRGDNELETFSDALLWAGGLLKEMQSNNFEK